MDPLSQATIGAVAAQSAVTRQDLARIGLIGALAGMAPDLDVLIQSSTDPLLQLEYHRQFTHSLVFIPIGALVCAVAFWPLVRRHMSFKAVWFTALVGYATHGLLDACTTYGTLLLWPFSDARIAWNTISVVDPLFTLPLLG
ncbi:MAG: metal-dependent hydrolase, partial [Gammaproteobacteria bacterium]|nr:metal-dependent hydrolase [Gammaproteobacteria bacterium]